MADAKNVYWHHATVTRGQKEELKKHRGATIWLTGLPSSGKSTIANALEYRLHLRGCHTVVLDGDNIRHGLNKNLGFSYEEREENIRRLAEVAKLFTSTGTINITAFISPYKGHRDAARALQANGDFLEIYVKCPVAVCEERDPKGLYRKARSGELKGFTGIDDPYEEPLAPELVLHTDRESPEDCVSSILSLLENRKIICA